MPDRTTDLIRRAYRGDRAHRHVVALSGYHRIQASPGYRMAARYVAEQLEAAGVQVTVHSYPADGRARFWSTPSFLEWDCAEAALHLLNESGAAEILCDFAAIPTSLVQRSISVAGEFEVVALGGKGGTIADDYAGLDMRGKAVLTDQRPGEVAALAVSQFGAAGVLFDGMRAGGRSELDLPDARQYSSFWWGGLATPDAWGFALSPRQGQRLRGLLANGKPVRVAASVTSRFYPGSFEVVDAFLPGADPAAGEILLVSHLCHPRPGAHDNGSGAAALIEAAITLARLIADGSLAQPRRGIRCLWPPEMTGTFAWLAEQGNLGSLGNLGNSVAGGRGQEAGGRSQEANEAKEASTVTLSGSTGQNASRRDTSEESRPGDRAAWPKIAQTNRWLAGLNLDMVGADQCRTGSVWELVSLPQAGASFADHLLSWLRGPFLDGQRHRETPFSAGSDHYILSDPTVGIPAPMLIQWPDIFYHTSADTPDKVSPDSLARSGALAAAYACWLAAAGAAEAAWLGHVMVSRHGASASKRAATAVEAVRCAADAAAAGRAWARYRRESAFRAERMAAALADLARIDASITGDLPVLRARIAAAEADELAWAQAQIAAVPLADPPPDEAPWRAEAVALSPRRLHPGPIDVSQALQADRPDLLPAYRALSTRAGDALHDQSAIWQYWADGRHTVVEIADLAALETGSEPNDVPLAYFKLLADAGLVALER